VDGDAAFADAAARCFESVGMRTVVALDFMAAVGAFDNNTIDVVVTDIKPPSANSVDLALSRMIKNKGPRAPIILMTAHQENALLGGTLCRPLEIAELCRAIRVRQTQ
jgi:DNA-binding NtrC family response regulator